MEQMMYENAIMPEITGESLVCEEKTGRFINPMTDFGFKFLFGSEPHKDLLMAFLNELFEGKKRIIDLEYNKNESHGPQKEFRSETYDLTCTGQDGEQFMIEVQRVDQPFFKDRAVYYTSSLIHEQGPKGSQWERPSSCRWQERWSSAWDYQMKEVHLIGLMEFCFADSPPEQFLHRVYLREENAREVFYEKLSYIFIELPKFKKAEDELETDLDRWLYSFRNMQNLQEISVNLKKPIFEKLYSIAAISNLPKKEYMAYEQNLKAHRDRYAAEKFMKEKALKEGRAEGRLEAKAEIVRKLLSGKKFSIPEIAGLADVTEAFVLEIKKDMN